MQIEEGKSYKTSDGRKVGPMHLGHGVKRAWVSGRSSAHDAEWEFDGRVVMAGPEKYGDLIAEWKDEPTGPVTIETVKRINTGTFKRVHVTPINGDFVSLHLQGQTFNATELRDISELATQLADALEGK